jgi:hypothetical protein
MTDNAVAIYTLAILLIGSDSTILLPNRRCPRDMKNGRPEGCAARFASATDEFG